MGNHGRVSSMNEMIQRPMVPQARVSGQDPLVELARIVGNRPETSRHEPRFAEPAYEVDDQHGWQDDSEADELSADHQAGDALAAEDELYDDTELHEEYALAAERSAPPVRQASRAGGMVAIAGLLLMAVAGGGAALAWKSGLLSSVALSGVGGPARLIQASTEPVKVIPAPVVADDGSAAAKEIFDRAGKAVSATQVKVVSREEQPVALPDVPSSEPVTAPRLSSMPSVGTTTVASTEEIDLTGPRKVKTIKILADGRAAPDVVPVRHPAMSTVAMADPMPAQPASDADTTASTDGFDTPAPAPMPIAQPPVRLKTAAKPVEAKAPDQPRAAPKILSQSKPVAKPVQVASLTQDDQPAAETGGFVVQVASQKTEADATATFKRIQGRFSSVLGAMKPSIRKADLGDKGTFYRIRVGPMASRDAAIDLCVKLKAAGGSCVVAKN